MTGHERVRSRVFAFLRCAFVFVAVAQPHSALTATAPSEVFGPFHGTFLQGGEGISEPLRADDPVLNATARWSFYGWVRAAGYPSGNTLLFGFGEPNGSDGRYVGLRNGVPSLTTGAGEPLQSPATLADGKWHFIAATFDGSTRRLYVDDAEVAQSAATLQPARPVMHIAPVAAQPVVHFGGQLASVTLLPRVLAEREIKALVAQAPDFELINFFNVSVGWPWQVRQQAGLLAPQAPATLPKSAAPFSKPVARRVDATAASLRPVNATTWAISGWRLADASDTSGDARAIATAGFADQRWHAATVPGTVLTTLIDRGVYPDPDYGLNNLAIPESLNKKDFWYRSEFTVPEAAVGRNLMVTFKGINYAAEVWFNGQRLGSVKGAFIRGVFDVTKQVVGGRNALAVRISPPPHPGIAHEQSIKAGPGENGGALALDGPTFIAAEGWDWIPGVRDRNIGLWQDVLLSATSSVRIGDPQVTTRLPLPDTNRADIEIDVALENLSDAPVSGILSASFDEVAVRKEVTLAPGATTVRLSPTEFRQLTIAQPRLWWPNGYGAQELYGLELAFSVGAQPSDRKSLRFGVRHVTYELSLFDEQGRLHRVEVNPTLGRERNERLVDVRHEALKKSPRGWAASLYPGALKSPAVRALADDSLTPHLVLLVNGVRIASRGGNWGMDDSRKRISRARLEPYFRLHREANLNTIRNWVGQNTEDEFFDLADEYGMLVLNDFWASTQDFQVEPEDPTLFLANARDTIQRYRNHPSIVLWFGRNEGVPHPILNSGLADLVTELDGTRHFTGSSNRVNLAGSGPYNYRPPVQYFNQHAEGYSVEVGTPSLSTLESIKAWTPPEDRWPISDALAYHDWHQGGNGDTATFMKTLETQFGAPSSLEDFERKAQMMNYVTHRALFEGFHAHLWTKNSGRLLWMTHPAWPSHSWQIYSSDYDTHAAFYGVKKACEPVHVQMNLPDFSLSVVNTTTRAHSGLTLRARVFTLDNRLLDEQQRQVDAAANKTVTAGTLDLQPHLQSQRLVLVKLELTDARGQVLSENFYWQGQDEAAHQALNGLPAANVRVAAQSVRVGDEVRVRATLENPGPAAALAAKLTLLDTQGERILPAYYSDNYVSLLPGETRVVEISYPAAAGTGARLSLRGWNVSSSEIRISKTR